MGNILDWSGLQRYHQNLMNSFNLKPGVDFSITGDLDWSIDGNSFPNSILLATMNCKWGTEWNFINTSASGWYLIDNTDGLVDKIDSVIDGEAVPNIIFIGGARLSRLEENPNTENDSAVEAGALYKTFHYLSAPPATVNVYNDVDFRTFLLRVMFFRYPSNAGTGIQITLLPASATQELTNTPFVDADCDSSHSATNVFTATVPSIKTLEHGQSIYLHLTHAGTSTAATLSINGGTAEPVYYMNSTRLTTHYGIGNVIRLTYLKNNWFSGTNIVGSGWWVDPCYDTNTVPNVLWESYGRFRIDSASYPLYRYKICGFSERGRLVPITATDQVNNTIVAKTPNPTPMKVSNGLVLYNTTTMVNSIDTDVASLYWYRGDAAGYHLYNFSANPGTLNTIYLCGNYDPSTDMFTLDTTSTTSFYTFVPYGTTTNLVAGKWYWRIGEKTTNASYCTFDLENPLFYCYTSYNLLNDVTELRLLPKELKNTPFVVEFGKTKWKEVYDAKQAGRVIFWNNGGIVYCTEFLYFSYDEEVEISIISPNSGNDEFAGFHAGYFYDSGGVDGNATITTSQWSWSRRAGMFIENYDDNDSLEMNTLATRSNIDSMFVEGSPTISS